MIEFMTHWGSVIAQSSLDLAGAVAAIVLSIAAAILSLVLVFLVMLFIIAILMIVLVLLTSPIWAAVLIYKVTHQQGSAE